MAAALSVAELRGLTRLHRADVEGAREQLDEIIAHRGEELPELLGFPRSNLRRLREHVDRVDVLVAMVDEASCVLRETRAQAQRVSARRFAATAGEAAVTNINGDVELDAAFVDAICAAWPGSGAVMFGTRGAVDIRRLRALLKQARRLPVLMLLTDESLNIKWDTSRSRGNFRLRLWTGEPGVDAVFVPLPSEPAWTVNPSAGAACVARASANGSPDALHALGAAAAGSVSTGNGSPCREDAPGSIAQGPRAAGIPTRSVEAPRRPGVRPPAKHGVVRFFEALAAAVGGSP